MLNCVIIMSKVNPLAGLLANYGDSDDEGEEDLRALKPEARSNGGAVTAPNNYSHASGAIHPAPIPHCPWSACYDETSGYTYYWNQQTNAVTWEAPPEYLLALKLAQQQMTVSGSGEVSAEEWQLYQQALAEKQVTQAKAAVKSTAKPSKKNEPNSTVNKGKNNKFNNKKRRHSDEEEEKIELITSYYNSDSDSNDEAEPPSKVKVIQPPIPGKAIVTEPPVPKPQPKPTAQKKPKVKTVEYGPALPPNASYSVPIGPDLPPELADVKSPDNKINDVQEAPVKEDPVKEDNTSKINDEDSQDETTLLMKLKDKAKILEKLGGEIPKELQQMIGEETSSGCATPKTDDSSQTNIDDLLEEIEKKELPKISKANKTSDGKKSNDASPKSSPGREGTPPLELKPLFPSIQNIKDTPTVETETQDKKVDIADKKVEVTEKKAVNLYLADTSERKETVSKKKLRISNSVLPKKTPEYTTKYSQFIEGFSTERVGLGFSKDSEEDVESSKNAISYGNGLVFTKGETLNEQKKDEDLDDLTELVEMKLKYLNQLQPCVLTPVQEMLVQMQTLGTAFRAGALSAPYYRRYSAAASSQLAEHERRAAPTGWSCTFQRSEGRYCYRRESDGLVQWEYPATTHTDMDICTTPPHPGIEDKEEVAPPPPPLPAERTACTTPPPPPPPALEAAAWRAGTPPPPAWADPPPPGVDDLPLLPAKPEPKQEIGDELASFYNDIAQLETVQSAPHTASNSPEPPVERLDKVKELHVEREPEKHQIFIERHIEIKDRQREKSKEKDTEKKRDKISKKKSKVKISASVGLKHKSVSNLVAKWQQVAEEINSD